MLDERRPEVRSVGTGSILICVLFSFDIKQSGRRAIQNQYENNRIYLLMQTKQTASQQKQQHQPLIFRSYDFGSFIMENLPFD